MRCAETLLVHRFVTSGPVRSMQKKLQLLQDMLQTPFLQEFETTDLDEENLNLIDESKNHLT